MRRRGFTLVELMAVVAITTVIASVAVYSIRKDRTQADCDKLAGVVRSAVLSARRRAVATQTPYLVEVQKKAVRWCQVDPATEVNAPSLTTTQRSCPPPNAALESSGNLIAATSNSSAGLDAEVGFYAGSADVIVPGATGAGSYTAATRIALPAGGVAIYLGPRGVADLDYATAKSAGSLVTGLAGATVYVQPTTTSGGAAQKHRRVVVYGVSARPRIIDNW